MLTCDVAVTKRLGSVVAAMFTAAISLGDNLAILLQLSASGRSAPTSILTTFPVFTLGSAEESFLLNPFPFPDAVSSLRFLISAASHQRSDLALAFARRSDDPER